MGLANLVPGISGGTMLLAAGVYPQFIDGIAEVTTLRFRFRTIALLGAIVVAAALSIVLGAGAIKQLVVDHRWAMYSIFIGLTFGGIPVIWKLIKPAGAKVWAGAAAGFAVMAAMAFVQPGASSEEGSWLLLFLAGLAGASAMILPGVSGGYLLLALGQYLPILSAIDEAKQAVSATGGPDLDVLRSVVLGVFVPVGLGVVLGVVGVSNVIRRLLHRHEKPTLGFLLGLLLGAVLGLWPFQQAAQPREGDIVKGRVMTPELIAALDEKDYPLETFSPSGGQSAASLALLCAGFAATMGVAAIGASGSASKR
jgi:putative membrane protein